MLDSPHIESPTADGVFVGIDWGNSHHQMCVVDVDGVVVEQGKAIHDVAGLAELTERLACHRVVGIAIERSEGLLVETLQAQGYRLFCVSRACQMVCVSRRS